MLDAQNFFHEVLAVTFVKSNIYTSEESFCQALYQVISFSSYAFNVYESYTNFISPIQTSIEKNVWRCSALIHKMQYLHEDCAMDKLWYNFPVVVGL